MVEHDFAKAFRYQSSPALFDHHYLKITDKFLAFSKKNLPCLEVFSTASLTALHWSVQKLLKSVASFSFKSLSLTNSISSTGSYFFDFKLSFHKYVEIRVHETDLVGSVVHVFKSREPLDRMTLETNL